MLGKPKACRKTKSPKFSASLSRVTPIGNAAPFLSSRSIYRSSPICSAFPSNIYSASSSGRATAPGRPGSSGAFSRMSARSRATNSSGSLRSSRTCSLPSVPRSEAKPYFPSRSTRPLFLRAAFGSGNRARKRRTAFFTHLRHGGGFGKPQGFCGGAAARDWVCALRVDRRIEGQTLVSSLRAALHGCRACYDNHDTAPTARAMAAAQGGRQVGVLRHPGRRPAFPYFDPGPLARVARRQRQTPPTFHGALSLSPSSTGIPRMHGA